MQATTSVPDNSSGLNPVELENALVAQWRGKISVEVVSVTRSTNEDLVLRSRAEQPSGCVLLAADFQTRGRGRQERIWHAAAGNALLFSVSIPIARVPKMLPAVTLACGVVLAECLADDGVSVRLKWPNDLRVGRSKLAGILTELVLDRAARPTLVIGVGMNLRLDEATRRIIGHPAVALDQLLDRSVERSREYWLGRLGSAIVAAAFEFVRAGFDPFCERFNRLLEMRGEWVDVIAGERQLVSGRVVGVDQMGRLMLEADGESHAVSVGDVSVRSPDQ
ncbi:MAG: biotin--[acetyl-CoA-carboxylase] ligase [Burkholderiaceae bacterium]